jgi:hypothetical protein
VAEILQCSRAHITRLCAGEVTVPIPIPFFRIGKKLVFREDAVRQWMEDCERAQQEGVIDGRSGNS